jgi:hypothetical protein
MSTPSLLLQCAGAASGLAAVWSLAGLSESSKAQLSSRVFAAAAFGVALCGLVVLRAPAGARSALGLPLLFAISSVLALALGAAKLDSALLLRDGKGAVRRASGLVLGSFLAMTAIGAASLSLSASSLAEVRVAWTLMFAIVAATSIVFAGRLRYTTAGVLALGPRLLLVLLLAVGILAGARAASTAAAARARAMVPPPVAISIATEQPSIAPSPPVVASAAPSAGVVVAASSAAPAASVGTAPTAPAPSVSVAPAAPAAPGAVGQLQIDSISTRGMLEADARGGIARRFQKLQDCVAEPANQQHGVITLKVSIDASGGVTYSRATGGDLAGTPLGSCLLSVFYKMGFAAPSSGSSSFEITLRAP